jgi:hypothetical protein
MAVDVTVRTAIHADRARVADFAMDPANDTQWIGGIRTARSLTPGPLGVGSRVERVAGFLGRSIRYVNEIEEFDPGRRLVMRSVEAPFPMRITYSFAESGANTQAGIRVEGEPGRFFHLFTPVLAWMVRRNVSQDLQRLKRLLEADSSSPQKWS